MRSSPNFPDSEEVASERLYPGGALNTV